MSNVVKDLQPRTWRSEKMQEQYINERTGSVTNDSCPLCTAEVKQQFEYWKIVPNKYPYDQVANIHDMIVTNRHAAWHELNQEELKELNELKNTILAEKYVFLIETFPKHRSVPGHFHLHLMVPKVIN